MHDERLDYRQWHVSGHVQGVAFRASTRARALELGVTGKAENLADGRVRVTACGTPEALDALGAWLRRGPRLARVDEVQAHGIEPFSCTGFGVG
ncbi:MAG: acylphosphatase [Gammaproteobacteria bacterium]|nr:acylphosphatase [Gammaproteobacteria bacterium]